MTRPDRVILEVPAGQDGLRLDRFLADVRPEWSRSQAARWVAEGHVTVNGRPAAKAAHLLRHGDRVEVHPPPVRPTELVAQAIPLDVLFEDEHLIAIN
ncbi:S4 domain-containing protein, partial [Arthrospira platensis SPKY1]|nr:S4 domain-containing protein [Arthrospira platensis SPKY1]